MPKKAMNNYGNRQRIKGAVFVLPAFAFHFVLITLPALSLLYYSLTNWNGISTLEFIGFENFIRAFSKDRGFHQAISNTLVWTLFFLIFPVILSILIALGVKSMKKSQMIFRSFFFLPYVIPPLVAGCVFSYLYSPFVGISTLFKGSGISFLEKFAPLGNMNQALFAVASADAWHFWGFAMVIVLSALHQVNTDLYEMADIEGANAFRKFIHVTLPAIIPTLVSLYMFIIIASFLTFDYVYSMTQGAPAGATEIAATWIYKRSFVSNEYGYGSAMSLIICSICVFVYFIFQFIQKYLEKRDVEI